MYRIAARLLASGEPINRLLRLPTASGWIARSTALLSIGICGDVEPNGLEQAVSFVDEKVERTPWHGVLHELSNDFLKTEHAIAHVEGFFEQVGDAAHSITGALAADRAVIRSACAEPLPDADAPASPNVPTPRS